MLKVLIVDDEPDLLEILQMFIEDEFDCSVMTAQSGEEAIKLLKLTSEIHVILCDYNMANGNGGEVYRYNLENKNIPFLHCSTFDIGQDQVFNNFDKDNSYNKVISKPYEVKLLYSTIQSILEEVEVNAVKPIHSKYNYHRIAVDRFLNLNDIINEVYLKISDDKYVKIAHKAHELDTEKILQYKEKGVKFLYLNEESYQHLNANVLDKILSSLKNENSNSGNIIEAQVMTVDELRHAAVRLGISKEVIEICDQLIESILGQIKSNTSMKNLLKVHESSNYIANHSQLINYLALGLLENMKWNTSETQRKIVLASILCDIGIQTDYNLAMIQGGEYPLIRTLAKSSAKLNKNLNPIKKEISDSECEEVLEHINFALKVLKKQVGGVITDEIGIIKMHHERPDGSGFPLGLTSSNIPPLIALFIISHEYTYHLLTSFKNLEDPSEEIIKKMGQSFSKHNFKEPFKSLLQVLEIEDFKF